MLGGVLGVCCRVHVKWCSLLCDSLRFWMTELGAKSRSWTGSLRLRIRRRKATYAEQTPHARRVLSIASSEPRAQPVHVRHCISQRIHCMADLGRLRVGLRGRRNVKPKVQVNVKVKVMMM